MSGRVDFCTKPTINAFVFFGTLVLFFWEGNRVDQVHSSQGIFTQQIPNIVERVLGGVVNACSSLIKTTYFTRIGNVSSFGTYTFGRRTS